MSLLAKMANKVATHDTLRPGPWIDYTGPNAQELKVEYSANPGILTLWQDADEKQVGTLRLFGGKASAKLRPGLYDLIMDGRTPTPREEYTIKITAPKQAVWEPNPKWKSDSNCGIHSSVTFTV